MTINVEMIILDCRTRALRSSFRQLERVNECPAPLAPSPKGPWNLILAERHNQAHSEVKTDDGLNGAHHHQLYQSDEL